jgi:hypothetical protein
MAVKWERKDRQEYGLNSRTVRSCEGRKRFPQQRLFVREGRSLRGDGISRFSDILG